jgi:photosynthetic reaction center cytochrome c subunit
MTKRIIIRSFRVAMLGLALSFLAANWATGNGARAPLADHNMPSANTADTGDSIESLSVDSRSAAGQAKSAESEKTADQVHKNIQVLKGLPDSQFFGVMRFMAASLGVNCNYCHVEGTGPRENLPWDKDDKEPKRTARKMILMMRGINRENFADRQVVNCATCHQGNPKPGSLPPLGQDVLRRLHAPTAGPKPAETLPAVDQVLDKYVQAVGGKAAFEKLKTRVMKAELVTTSGRTISQEIYRQVPNKVLIITTAPNGVSSQGFNGTIGWMKTNEGVEELNSFAVADFKFNADFNREIRLKELYRKLSVTGKEKIGDNETYVVEAIPQEGSPEKLYFDTQTGLLVRRAADEITAFGPIPDHTDLEDYKEADGVKLPFTARRSSQWTNLTLRIIEVKHNVTIAETKFDKPVANQ